MGSDLKCGVCAGADWERGLGQGELGSAPAGHSPAPGAAASPAQHPWAPTPVKGDFSSLPCQGPDSRAEGISVKQPRRPTQK